jgi:hypothetical protein
MFKTSYSTVNTTQHGSPPNLTTTTSTTPPPKPLPLILNILGNLRHKGLKEAYHSSFSHDSKEDVFDLFKRLSRRESQSNEPVEIKFGKNLYTLNDSSQGVSIKDLATNETAIAYGLTLSDLKDSIREDCDYDYFKSGIDQSGYEKTEGIFLDINPQKQKRTNACGDTCVNILLQYHGRDFPIITVNDRGMFTGSGLDDLKTTLRNAGLRCTDVPPDRPNSYTADQIEGLLKNDGPIMCSLKGHAVLITGVDFNGSIVIHCPLLGKRMATLDDLNKNLDWAGDPPLTTVRQKTYDTQREINSGMPQPCRKQSNAEKIATSVLTTGYKALNFNWLKDPDEFKKEHRM